MYSETIYLEGITQSRMSGGGGGPRRPIYEGVSLLYVAGASFQP